MSVTTAEASASATCDDAGWDTGDPPPLPNPSSPSPFPNPNNENINITNPTYNKNNEKPVVISISKDRFESFMEGISSEEYIRSISRGEGARSRDPSQTSDISMSNERAGSISSRGSLTELENQNQNIEGRRPFKKGIRKRSAIESYEIQDCVENSRHGTTQKVRKTTLNSNGKVDKTENLDTYRRTSNNKW